MGVLRRVRPHLPAAVPRRRCSVSPFPTSPAWRAVHRRRPDLDTAGAPGVVGRVPELPGPEASRWCPTTSRPLRSAPSATRSRSSSSTRRRRRTRFPGASGSRGSGGGRSKVDADLNGPTARPVGRLTVGLVGTVGQLASVTAPPATAMASTASPSVPFTRSWYRPACTLAKTAAKSTPSCTFAPPDAGMGTRPRLPDRPDLDLRPLQ